MNIVKKVAITLKRIRKSKNLVSTELSSISGVSQSTISDIESARRSPQIDTLYKLISALGYTLEDFFRLIELNNNSLDNKFIFFNEINKLNLNEDDYKTLIRIAEQLSSNKS